MNKALPPSLDETRATNRVPWALAIATAIAAGLLVLWFLGSRIARGDAFAFDRALILSLRVPGDPAVAIGSPRFASAVRDVTALGSGTVLTIVVVIALGILLLRRDLRTALLVGVATLGGGQAVSLLKGALLRPRPDIVGHLMHESSASFPSGHAANSAIVYLTLATLVFPLLPEKRLRAFVLLSAMALVGAIGASRVYLGVHWPSDVLAGWTFGAIWALGWWWIETRWFRSTRRTARRD